VKQSTQASYHDRFSLAFGHRIIPRASRPAHARLNARGLKPGNVITASILNPAIGVVYQFTSHHRAGGQCLKIARAWSRSPRSFVEYTLLSTATPVGARND
jgi:hypothetical protein